VGPIQPRTARDRVRIVRAALARFNSESPELIIVTDEIGEANGDVVVVGRVQGWRDGHLSQELATALLWEFEDDDLVRINQFASKQAALDGARFTQGLCQ
jgi:hypothetical protein